MPGAELSIVVPGHFYAPPQGAHMQSQIPVAEGVPTVRASLPSPRHHLHSFLSPPTPSLDVMRPILFLPLYLTASGEVGPSQKSSCVLPEPC
eukprot:2831266-Rhodomonas_salina.2